MFAQPLTDTRRPALTHTSAFAVPGPVMVAIAPGMVAMVQTHAAAAAHDRVE
jgi:hypothetical protein